MDVLFNLYTLLISFLCCIHLKYTHNICGLKKSWSYFVQLSFQMVKNVFITLKKRDIFFEIVFCFPQRSHYRGKMVANGISH